MSLFKKLFSLENAENILGLVDSAKALYIYEKFLKEKKSSIIVTSSLYEANELFLMLQDYTTDVFLFPMDDFLTSEALATSPELRYTRLETLQNLMKHNPVIVVTNLMGYLRYLPAPSIYQQYQIVLEKNKDYNIKELISKFLTMGYVKETIVTKTGELAIRGFVLDIFPIGENNPIRLEFWGDTLDSIRTFDTETQLSKESLEIVEITPIGEFLVESEQNLIYRLMPNYIEVGNITSYMKNPIIFKIDSTQLQTSYETLQNEILEYNFGLGIDGNTKYMHDLSSLKEEQVIYLENFDDAMKKQNSIRYQTFESDIFPLELKEIEKKLQSYLKDHKTVVIFFSDRYQMNRLLDISTLESYVVTDENEILDNKINLIIKHLVKGFRYDSYVILTDRELFSKKETRIQYKSKFKYGTKIKDITKLKIGDYVVHNIHGIGRYLGLKTLEKNHLKKDYLMIEYKDSDKLYIPVEKIELISKYSSNEGAVPKINKLGSTEWEKTKARVRKKIEDIAGELLKLYAEREASLGFSFIKDDPTQFEFEKAFPYEDTIDQHKVTEEIKRDMEKSQPMDRLLCGDVGYGKTEVAFRAIMKAALSSKQSAFLCPTTILSKQHYQNALDRFEGFGVNIALLNRFTTPKQLKEIKDELKKGTLDLLIGTHRILSSDIVFKDLGLLVVDEEQRFGVKHKEKIKSMKTNVDVLTLSATPIPRTLQMSMTGVRSLSLIETPPTNRYPVQTYVLAENKNIIKDAIYKELSRGGQIFILYNHVDEMEQKKLELERFLPNVRIISAHGQMPKRELEDVMLKFTAHEYDILLCTTIIETGIDIPSVNTLIIMDADRFGLSQLYQIRGRVGRSNKIAYCYLMYQPGKVLSEIAMKRLNVIKEFTELGSGFSIAMRDLAIRGAGDILGSEQAGFVDSIGIELYLNMLNEEVNKLKGIPVIEPEITEKPLLEVETSIADQYVDDTDLKIEIHKKINHINSYESLEVTKRELEDRFGNIGNSLEIYMYEEWFEKMANDLGIKDVRQTNNFIEIKLPITLTEKIHGDSLFLEVMKIHRKFRFAMKMKQVVITLDLINLEKHFIYYLIPLLQIIKKNVSD